MPTVEENILGQDGRGSPFKHQKIITPCVSNIAWTMPLAIPFALGSDTSTIWHKCLTCLLSMTPSLMCWKSHCPNETASNNLLIPQHLHFLYKHVPLLLEGVLLHTTGVYAQWFFSTLQSGCLVGVRKALPEMLISCGPQAHVPKSPWSPDINLIDVYLCGYMQKVVYTKNADTRQWFMQCIWDAADKTHPIPRVLKCIQIFLWHPSDMYDANRGHLKHFLYHAQWLKPLLVKYFTFQRYWNIIQVSSSIQFYRTSGPGSFLLRCEQAFPHMKQKKWSFI
jgi:hypothetical protein